MKLSAIIVTYNHESEIKQCLQSLQQSPICSAIEIILIDNCSRDETLAMLTPFLNSFSRFEILKNKKNLGFTQAVNQGLNLVSNDFILLLNPDTIIPENTIPQLLDYLAQNPTVGAVSPQFRNPDGSIQPSCRRFPRRRDVIYNALGLSFLFSHNKEFNYWKMGDFNHKELREVEQPQGAFLLFKKKVIEKIGYLDEKFPMFFSDVDLCHRIIDAGWQIHFVPDVHIIHLKGTSVYKNRLKMIITSHKSFYRYFKKYYSGFFNQVVNFMLAIFLLVMATVRLAFSIFESSLKTRFL